MKIVLDEESYVEIYEKNKSIFLSIRTKRDDSSFILLTTKLDNESVDEIITALVGLKSKIN